MTLNTNAMDHDRAMWPLLDSVMPLFAVSRVNMTILTTQRTPHIEQM